MKLTEIQITKAEWAGPYADHPAVQAAVIQRHGDIICARATQLLRSAVVDGVPLDLNQRLHSEISGAGNGGVRPPDATVGAPLSAHKDGRALDLYDPKRLIMAWLLGAGRQMLETLELYVEHPQWTRSWVHVQYGPPKSGNRFFVPYSDLVAHPPTCVALPGQKAANVPVFKYKAAA